MTTDDRYDIDLGEYLRGLAHWWWVIVLLAALGAVLGAESGERVAGTLATTVLGAAAGAAVFRVHDVRPNLEALRVAMAVLGAGASA